MPRPVDPHRRAAVLAKAADYVLERGLAGLSLRPFAKALGTSTRMLLYDFGSKELLIHEVLAEIRRREETLLEAEVHTLDDVWAWISAPEREPFLRLFFEIYVGALGRKEARPLVHDWLYELRLFALEQLSAMHADLFLCDPHRIIVNGPTKLRGRHLDARDLRSGMALIAAALAADGVSHIEPVETVERGYASLVERLTLLGATVERKD
jgi:UDP-N-acetylglucosamine enolpyruvyl transferase